MREAAALARAPDAPGVEARLVELARSGAPLRRVIAALAGRLVEIRGWERLSFVRLRDYAMERLGLSARQVQDLAHVDRELARLPAIAAAFVAGRLTWTKVRLLCRIATPEDEAAWIEAAKGMTARELSREVRSVDARALENAGMPETDEDRVEEMPRETVWLRVTPRVRARWGRARLVACRVAGESLSQAAVAEAVAAEVMSAIGLDEEIDFTPPPIGTANGCAEKGLVWETLAPVHEASSSSTPSANGCAAHASLALPTFLAPLVENLESADPFELDARLRRALRLEQRVLAEMSPLLLDLARRRTFRQHGYASLGDFARERLGMSTRKAHALLRLERACEHSVELREAFRNGRLSWVQAHAVVPIVTLRGAEPKCAAWVAHAERVSVRRIEEDVERALATGTLDPGSTDSDVQTGAHPTISGETIKLFFAAPTDVARLFKAVLATVQRRIERRDNRTASESEALDAMLEHCFETWQPANTKARAEHRVFERDGWRCTVPGCTSFRNLHDHHIQFRSAGGSDELSNRTTLCAAHHQRGVHAGIIRIRGSAPGKLYYELGVRRDGGPLVTYGPREEVL